MSEQAPESDEFAVVAEIVASHLRGCTPCDEMPPGEHIAHHVVYALFGSPETPRADR